MPRLLLVDDEEHIRVLYRDELADEGYEVYTAASGYDLLRKIALWRPEVVVLDIKLVDDDGLELLQEIRNHYHNLPVVLSTAYDSYKGDPQAIAADYYVLKSFDLSELKTAVRRAVEGNVHLGAARQ